MPRDASCQRRPAGLAAGAKRVLTLQHYGSSSDAQQAHKHMHTHTHKSAITSKAGFPALTSLFIETVADIIGHLMDVMFKPQKLIFHQE